MSQTPPSLRSRRASGKPWSTSASTRTSTGTVTTAAAVVARPRSRSPTSRRAPLGGIGRDPAVRAHDRHLDADLPAAASAGTVAVATSTSARSGSPVACRTPHRYWSPSCGSGFSQVNTTEPSAWRVPCSPAGAGTTSSIRVGSVALRELRRGRGPVVGSSAQRHGTDRDHGREHDDARRRCPPPGAPDRAARSRPARPPAARGWARRTPDAGRAPAPGSGATDGDAAHPRRLVGAGAATGGTDVRLRGHADDRAQPRRVLPATVRGLRRQPAVLARCRARPSGPAA